MKLINGHLNTSYSFLKSSITSDELKDFLLQENPEYLVISEYNNFFSYAQFLLFSKKNNIKIIFALEVDIKLENKKYRYILYAQNEEGFNLIKRISNEILSGKELCSLDTLLGNKNIKIVEHPLFGFYTVEHKKLVSSSNYFYSFQLSDIQKNKEFIIKNLHNSLVINHFCILDISENEIINLLSKTNGDEKDKNIVYQPLNFEFEIKDELEKTLINNTNNLLKSCYFETKINPYVLPHFENELNMNSKQFLRYLLKQKLTQKFNEKTFTKEYQKRLEYELSIIEKLNFEDYFLIIQDYVNWAKNNKISIGPGRGSASGSLVSFILGITEIDPLKYGLLFERFLNPERVSMPDIDVDVQDNRRDEVIEYLIKKYGEKRVANIVTFSTLGKKSAIRDVLRVYGVSPSLINEISKSISDEDINLVEEYQKNQKFALLMARIENITNLLITQIVYNSSKLEGLYRQTGTHAAGIVISPKNIEEIIPTYFLSNNVQQVQSAMENLEPFGLLKMDILGLKTLTTIQEILDKINEGKKEEFKLKNINFNDKKTFELLTSGQTTGIFQLESPGMIKTLQKVKVSTFNDIVAVISLFRPGPMLNLTTYARRKHGIEKVPKISPEFDKIVEETYGIIVYQEQIMQIAQKVAKMSYGEADILRRAISKKKLDEMERLKEKFIKDSIKNNYPKQISEKIYAAIEEFASYGFNKAHAVSYAYLSYQMAYLKAHFPLEYYAAIISSNRGSQTNINKYVNEAKSLNISVASPDINFSSFVSEIKNETIYLPLAMIKGIGPETIKNLVKNRKEYGPYKSFAHFCMCVSLIKNFGISNIETLIKASALRCFNLSQKTMLHEISNPNSYLMLSLKMQNLENLNLLDISTKSSEIEIKNTKDDKIEEIKANEIEFLGQSYNTNILQSWEKIGSQLKDLHFGNSYVVVVECENVLKRVARNGKDFYILTLSDSSQKLQVFAFNATEDLIKFKNKIIEAEIILKSDGRHKLTKIKEYFVTKG
ncbi:DNA polymerase-3 subunit alpha [Metamycoplasma subdolum]|uniref:DNA-directed DNA polymerase n=1 Tax=Metamycoplasma subdolum TaxID=92407 RepID=A0A3M0A363_9BACT|nr:DNA polymerase III subunit alpha [Metamycoplasma subdolum]RMA79086.1 DNA polymerase-3 subunit alpha [Metamycoplasma subdolum]WPB50609.1 DNA polymerase III subunit alpha [Metamycoplasma subdolum]